MVIYFIISIIAAGYLALVLLLYFGLRRILSRQSFIITTKTKLSIVVAFRNEEKNLPLLLDALLNQTISRDLFELILVNDHSTDGSLSVIQPYKDQFQNLTVITSFRKVKGKKTALLCGIDLAQYPIVVFTDADCIPHKTWLETLSSKFPNDFDFIIGPVILSPIDGFVSKFQSLEYSSFMATAAGSCSIGHPVIASSANLAFRRELLDVDLYKLQSNISSGDDMFLLHSAKKIRSCKIDFLNDCNAVVCTSSEPTLKLALNQRKRWASKSIYYKDFDTIFTSIVVFAFNLMLFGLVIASFILIKYLLIFLCLLFVKSLVDFLLLNRYLRFTKQEELMKVFIPLQLLYPLYVVYTFFSGVFFKITWKGRRIK